MFRVTLKPVFNEKPEQALFRHNGLALRQWCKGTWLKLDSEQQKVAEFEVSEQREIVVEVIRAEGLREVEAVKGEA